MDSIERPAWTQDDLHAYRNKYPVKGRVKKGYYNKACNQVGKLKTKGVISAAERNG